jgi:effector-binding domain-containing protein
MLKEICENEAKGIFRGFQVETILFPGKKFLGKRAKLKFEELTSFYSEHFPAVATVLEGGQIQMDGMPSGLIYEFDEVNGLIDVAAAIGFKGDASLEGYEVIELPARKALLINYYGTYEESDKAHYAMDDYLKYQNLTPKMPVIEEYVTDPGLEPDPNKWLTKITYLLEN